MIATSGRPALRASVQLSTLLALCAGLTGGILAAKIDDPRLPNVLEATDLVGNLWVDGLTMTIVPLIFGLLVTGIAAATGAAQSRVASRAIFWFAILLISTCLLAAVATTAMLYFHPVPTSAALLSAHAQPPTIAAPAEWIRNLIPANPVKAAADTAMVPLVVFALLFALALARIDQELQKAILLFFRGVTEIMLVIVQWVLFFAPIGVLALAFSVGVRTGLGAAGALVHYVVVAAAACLLAAAISWVAASVVGRISPIKFARAALPAQIIGLSTQSSLASLPAMVAAAPGLHVSASSAGIVLPLAVSLFRAASAAANVAVAVYLAHLHGISLGVSSLLIGALIAVPVSLAAVGLPAQVSYFTTIGPVCMAMGIPISLLPLLLAVETIPDIFRTFGNVTADLAVLRIAGRTSAPSGIVGETDHASRR